MWWGNSPGSAAEHVAAPTRDDGVVQSIRSPYFESVAARRRATVLADYLPPRLDGFVDLFLDGGSLAITAMSRHPDAFVTLASPHPDLLAVWEAARAEPEALVDAVAFHAERHAPAYFAAVRDSIVRGEQSRAGESGAASALTEQAARFVYLRGTAAPDAHGRPRRRFDGARSGRDTVAFDAANLRALGRLLAERDVAFVERLPFEVLGDIREGDLVLLDPPGDPAESVSPRELRSLAGSITARAGLVLAPGGEGGTADGPASAGLTALGSHDDLEIWGNGGLARVLRDAG